MKKFWYIILLVVGSIAVFSCSDDDEIEIDPVWLGKNQDFINQLRVNDEYKSIIAPSKQDTVFYKVLKEGTGERPLSTATVEVYYKGCLIDGTVFDSSKGYETLETDDDVLAQFPLLSYSSTSATSYGVIEGWALALQHMRVGDKWEVCIPYSLAYGISGQGDIPGCSTLVFEIELVNIVTQTTKSR